MDTFQTGQTVGALIMAALAEQERTTTWLADRLGITPATLRRRIHSEQLTAANLVKIAALLHIPPADLIPDSWHEVAA